MSEPSDPEKHLRSEHSERLNSVENSIDHAQQLRALAGTI
jgi:hypothetical protein